MSELVPGVYTLTISPRKAAIRLDASSSLASLCAEPCLLLRVGGCKDLTELENRLPAERLGMNVLASGLWHDVERTVSDALFNDERTSGNLANVQRSIRLCPKTSTPGEIPVALLTSLDDTRKHQLHGVYPITGSISGYAPQSGEHFVVANRSYDQSARSG